ncbi:MAG: FHA domain-containing protein [Deltaproteobacteria bacterium]|nr:FHA domain-containing protein [Deltaproteobacteria bacterium]
MSRIQELVEAGIATDGYLEIETGTEQAFLFLHQGKTYCAGAEEDGRFVARSLGWFFATAPRAQKVSFYKTDLPLFLCSAVLFRKAPSAIVPVSMMDGEALLAMLLEKKKDSVLVIRHGRARSLVFCRQGVPTKVYAAPGEVFPSAGGVTESILAYIYNDPWRTEPVSVDLYDEIKLPPDREGGKPITAYTIAPEANALEWNLSLLVKLGSRVVFRFPVDRDEIHVGRSGENELILDNLSVSRHHAVITCRPSGSLEIVDQDSENGLKLRGRLVRSAVLEVGAEIGIGKYTLSVEDDRAAEAVEAPPPPDPVAAAVASFDRTVAVTSGGPIARVAHDGKMHEMWGSVFLIGKSPNTHIPIRGLFVAPVHVRIEKQADGSFLAEHLAGRRSLRVNGEKVKRHVLRSGDTLAIAHKEFTFRLPG